MNYLTVLFSLSALLASPLALARGEGETTWKFFNLGNQKYSYPSKIKTDLLLIGGHALGENELEKACHGLKEKFESPLMQGNIYKGPYPKCIENGDIPSCKIVESFFKFHLTSSKRRKWKMATFKSPLRTPKDVQWVTPQLDFKRKPAPKMTYRDGSYMQKLKMVSIITGNKIQDSAKVFYGFNYFVANNKFLACDILNKKIKLKKTLETTVEHFQKPDRKMVEAAWYLYKKQGARLKGIHKMTQQKLIQAALAGYDLRKDLEELNQSPLKKDRKNFVYLFQNFYELDRSNLEMKFFGEMSDLKDQLYPDQHFSKTIKTIWSHQ